MNPTTAYDVFVVGAGHAGCEAALAAARMGGRVALCTLSRDKIAEMPCNPAVGGLAKSHLVREIDALGGAMGRVIDRTGIQFRVLNRGKGPAVRAPRAQADKHLYKSDMRRVVESAPGIDLLEAEVKRVTFTGSRVTGVVIDGDVEIPIGSIVITTGTFLYGLMHIGDETIEGGRRGERRTTELSDCVRGLGLELGRFKTGTPPRLHRDTIRTDRMLEQPGESPAPAFSHFTRAIPQRQVSCWSTRTSGETADIVRENSKLSPLFSGQIQGIGPRYCPSIEDKYQKFPDKPDHQIFLEPEGYDVDEVYVNGLSTSLPLTVQTRMVRSIPGLEQAELLRPGYAVEYDCIFPQQLSRTLMIDAYPGLFFAGQINGTSGYEEAAAQGLYGGVNALRFVRGEAPLTLARSDAYMGVLIDDLVTRGTREPYRMFTSQAEYRLLLRFDNAGDRLGERGREFGLLTDAEADWLAAHAETASRYRRHVETTPVPTPAATLLEAASGRTIVGRVRNWGEVLKQPEFSIDALVDAGLADVAGFADVEVDLREVRQKVEVAVKYAGYVDRMEREVARHARLDGRRIPPGVFDGDLRGMSSEAVAKLRDVRPETVGQAQRISGVRSSDVSMLLVHVERARTLAETHLPKT
jgi:tRNA uridine 5-carboxymethylaminomethyl modification enzyme